MNQKLEKTKNKILNYISYKRRTQKEVIDRLKKEDVEEEIIEEVIKFLKEYNYVNDYQYTKLYIENLKRTKPVGKRAIYYKLKEKGIDSNTVDMALDEIDYNEKDLVNVLLKKKYSKDLATISKKEKEKIFRYLSQRGFNYHDIKEVIYRRS